MNILYIYKFSFFRTKFKVFQKDLSLRKTVENETEHDSTHLGVTARMSLNTRHAAHLGIMMKSAHDNLKYPSWQNCYAELPQPLIS